MMKIVTIQHRIRTSTVTWKRSPTLINNLEKQFSSGSSPPLSSSDKDTRHHRPAMNLLTQTSFLKFFRQSYDDIYSSYEKFVHLNEVRQQQEKVIELQVINQNEKNGSGNLIQKDFNLKKNIFLTVLFAKTNFNPKIRKEFQSNFSTEICFSFLSDGNSFFNTNFNTNDVRNSIGILG